VVGETHLQGDSFVFGERTHADQERRASARRGSEHAFAAARPLISTSPSTTAIRLGKRVCSGETPNKRKTG
jgi:hypothetical protein